MLRSSLFSSVVAAAILFAAPAVFADNFITYDLSNVTLSAPDTLSGSGGNLTGYFTVDTTKTTLSDWSIMASAFGGFSQFTYTPANSVGIDGLASMYIQSTDNTNNFQLRLYFPQGTVNPPPSGTALLTGGFSYDSQPTAGVGQNRFVTGGTVVIDDNSRVGVAAVPLPSAAWMAAPVLAGLALLKARKKAVPVEA